MIKTVSLIDWLINWLIDDRLVAHYLSSVIFYTYKYTEIQSVSFKPLLKEQAMLLHRATHFENEMIIDRTKCANVSFWSPSIQDECCIMKDIWANGIRFLKCGHIQFCHINCPRSIYSLISLGRGSCSTFCTKWTVLAELSKFFLISEQHNVRRVRGDSEQNFNRLYRPGLVRRLMNFSALQRLNSSRFTSAPDSNNM